MKEEPDTTAFSLAVRQKAGIARVVEDARAERAEEVKASYLIEEAGSGLYFCQHPVEDDRAYIVDIGAGTCECPDYQIRCQELGWECKHLTAIRDLTGIPRPVDKAREEAKELDRRFSQSMAELADMDPYAD